jgi:hypothetical protein
MATRRDEWSGIQGVFTLRGSISDGGLAIDFAAVTRRNA